MIRRSLLRSALLPVPIVRVHCSPEEHDQRKLCPYYTHERQDRLAQEVYTRAGLKAKCPLLGSAFE